MNEKGDRRETEQDTRKDDRESHEICIDHNIKWKVVCGSCGAGAPCNKHACQCPQCGAMAHWISIKD